MSRPRRVLGYARVSSAEQALGSSLRDQQAAIAAYAATRGLKVTRFYVEAESAIYEKIERREQMQALMREVRAGDLVLCDKIDRWSRDPEFTYGSVRRILELGASIYFVGDACDPSTDIGDSMLGMRAYFAREEHKRIRQRTVGTRNLLRERGYYVEGTPPFGYRRSTAKDIERNVLVVDPEAAELVREMFRLALAGKSLSQIARALGLGRKRVWSSLRCRSYLGEIKTSRGWVRGKHEPIIDAATFERVQRALTERRLGGPRPRDALAETDTWILRSIAVCAHCGAKMRSAYAGPKGEGRRYYYWCGRRCRRRYVPVALAEEKVGPLVLERLAELREELARPPKSKGPTIDFGARRRRLQQRRERYLDAHADGLMTLAELRAALAKVDEERLRLDAEAASSTPVLDAETKRTTLRELATLEQAWRRATPALRREIVARLAVRVGVAEDGSVQPVWRPLAELRA